MCHSSSPLNISLLQLPEEQKEILKGQIISCVQNEPDKNVRRKVADLAAEVARNLTDDDGNNLWPDFLTFLFTMASSPSPDAKEIALHMFASVPSVFGNQEQKYMDVIKNMLSSSLTDQTYEVRFGAVKATCNYLLLHDKDNNLQKHFSDVLGPIMNVTVESVEKQDDDACLKSLIDIAESMPKFLRPQLEQIFALCLKMIGNQDLEENWRHLALEITVTTAETAPAMVRKVVGGSVGPLVQACLQMMCDIEEEEDWAVSDEPQVKLKKSAPKDEIILQHDDKPSGGMILKIPKDVYKTSDTNNNEPSIVALSILSST